MPSALDTLIGRITDEQLRADIRAAVSDLRKITDFGLVFEAHLPETVRLPHHSIRRGVKVTLRDLADQSMFEVVSVNDGTATIRRLRHPDGSALSRQEATEVENQKSPLSSLVALAEFGDPIYPGLRRLGSLGRGGEKPAHIVINGENYHALEALQFSHAGKIDCIYIDPPYNSGARDWKYNNNYVDDDDGYRHSKWLAFMSRRLKLAKNLMKPEDSVLIVTIDEKEVHRLGLLIGQLFPGAKTQMVTIVTNQRGVARGQEFARVDEYAFVVFCGSRHRHATAR
jgi:adenine-specific DNA-methyltransferase